MSDYTPVFTPGQTVSLTASGTIVGGQLVEVSGNGTVAAAAAGSTKAIGVAAFDVATGARVTVHIGKVVQEATASGAVNAGDMLAAAANGQVAASATPAVGAQIGVAITTAASGAKVRYVTR